MNMNSFNNVMDFENNNAKTQNAVRLDTIEKKYLSLCQELNNVFPGLINRVKTLEENNKQLQQKIIELENKQNKVQFNPILNTSTGLSFAPSSGNPSFKF